MRVPLKRIVLRADDALWRKTHPVLLDVFCRGVKAAAPRRLVLQALLDIGIAPSAWVVIAAKNAIHIVILLTTWWILRDSLDPYEVELLALGALAIFYKDIYNELADLLLRFLVFLTGGKFLKWVCSGYLSGSGFRQDWFTRPAMERVIATMCRAIPMEYRAKYEHVMNLYFESNEPQKERELEELLEDYSAARFF